MAYNKENLYKQAEQAIKGNNLFFIEDVISFMPCAKPTFYDYFKPESNELNNLKELLEQNKIKTKSAIRSKLFKSEKAGELLALYRLICTNEERQMLNQQYMDLTTRGQALNIERKSVNELFPPELNAAD